VRSDGANSTRPSAAGFATFHRLVGAACESARARRLRFLDGAATFGGLVMARRRRLVRASRFFPTEWHEPRTGAAHLRRACPTRPT